MPSHPLPSSTLAGLRAQASSVAPVRVSGADRVVLFLSHSDGRARASVITASAPDGASAWSSIERHLAALDARPRWLRLDWVHAVEETTWDGLRAALQGVKRNYFRYGIALDADFRHAFLEGELNANAMLYGGSQEPAALLNERNFRLYARKRHGLGDLGFASSDPVWIFATQAVFVGDDGVQRELAHDLLNSGRREVEAMSPELVRELIAAGSAYLADQVQPRGRFNYGWHPCFDRPIAAYNTLRHASSLYAMFEAWEVTRDPALWQACERALRHLTQDLIHPSGPAEGPAAWLVDAQDEVKLGGNAVAILALLEHARITGSRPSLELAARLGEGILRMQDAQSGSFVHVLNFPALDVKEPFRIIYYEGEAAFALIRLYNATGDARWLEAAESACDHFIRQDFARYHDHWLGYFIANLVKHRPEERYIRFGIDNFAGHLDFVSSRITTFPTLLELMMASHDLLRIVHRAPKARQLLQAVDLPRFYSALDYRAHYLLNGHFWPELAMYFANPQRIVGSFFIRHHAFRVRIDDVEHYLSGLVAYLRFLRRGEGPIEASPCPSAGTTGSHPERGGPWSATHLVRATGGRWRAAPPFGWSASGLCSSARKFREGDILALRAPGEDVGVRARQVAQMIAPPAAWLVHETEDLDSGGAPVLQVRSVRSATMALGSYARARMSGKVIAIAGSAGKSATVPMLARALQAYGSVAETRDIGSRPSQLASELASIPWNVDHFVIELPSERIKQNARLVRPDLAVITNILADAPAATSDCPWVAAGMQPIIEAMKPGGVVVLNGDIDEWRRVSLAATIRGLRVVSYGRSADCDLQLLDFEPATMTVRARFGAHTFTFQVDGPGVAEPAHALAALAAIAALGHDPRVTAGLLHTGGRRPARKQGRTFRRGAGGDG